MITTIEPLLTEVSQMLGETSTDSSNARIGFANRAISYVFQQYAWSFRRKELSLNAVAGVQTYDLTSPAIVPDNDYDPEFGVYEVWHGTERMSPMLYESISNIGDTQNFALTPDNKKIVFGGTLTTNTTFTVWYYARHVDVASKTTTLKVAIPDNFRLPICTYIRHLVHDRKRQRNDARNMILDCQEQISDLKMAQSKSKARGLKRNIPTPLQYVSFNRNYNY